MSLPLTHFSKRAKMEAGARRPIVNLLDRCMLVVALIGPVMTLPQILTIWADKQTSGVSVSSWIAYTFVSGFWVVYGIVHREKLVTFINILWVILGVVIVVGILK